MKYLRALIFGSFLLFLMSCYSNRIPSGATKHTATAMVSKDCSGTYLRLSNGDHFVCNWKMLEDYKNGDIVTATFVYSDNCKRQGPFDICMVNHPTAGFVTVASIK